MLKRLSTSVLSLLLSCTATTATAAEPARVRAYVDADTANEVDDPYAIYRALVAPELEVVGLSSMSWKSADDFAAGTRKSQRMNEEILALTGRAGAVSHPLGALAPMPDERTPVDSPAARDIIAKAKETPDGTKLRVYVLGGYTNVASALLLDAGLKERIAVYLMGYKYADGRFTTDEFNAEGDLNAARYMLRSGVELHVMPANILGRFLWSRAAVDEHFKGRGGVRDYLVARWQSEAPRDAQRILWDIAVFEATLRPALAKAEDAKVDGGATVHVWVEVDVAGMQADYWKATEGGR